MRIERNHFPWAAISILLVVGGGYVYYGYSKLAVNGPSGSSIIGLTFGIIAAVCMGFVGALGLRRRYRSARVGSARFWLRGHLWIGFITLPLAWFHAGFRNGGALTLVIMILLYAVWLSGIYGIILQQFLPRYLKIKVPNETLASQIDAAINGLKTEAEKLGGTTALYTASVKPFLEATPTSASLAAVTTACNQARTKSDAGNTTAIDGLEKICRNYKSLFVERRLLWWMHSWLLIHVPLSMALLLLTAIHIIMALRLTF